ncbi:MAG: glycosyltransferase family 2 protein [Planctomycetota bacterium]
MSKLSLSAVSDTDTLVGLMASGDLSSPVAAAVEPPGPARPQAPPPAAPAMSATPIPAPREAKALRVQRLSVVVPARDESLNLPALLQELEVVLAPLPLAFREIVVVDDGSRDDTPALAERHGARVVRHPESLGNGAAVKRGIREAKGDWILLLDGDGQHPPDAIPSMLALAERFDMVVGSRGGSGGKLHRNVANRIYNRLASYVSGRRIPDLTSGYRLLRADVAKGLVYLLPNTFSYPTTITMSMLRAGYAVAFHPITVRPRQGKSHIRLLADGSRFFLIILRIATFFAPLRVFLPLSLALAATGVGWYAYTWFVEHRFTNMAVLLLGQATLLFALGLISEQIAALRFQRLGSSDEPR